MAAGLGLSEQKLLPAELDVNDGFGGAVAVHKNIAVIGARFDDDGGDDAGAAYVYRRTGRTWVFDDKLTASDAQEGDEFGVSVAVHDEFIVVGAHFEDSNGQNAGAAYVFTRASGAWEEDQKLLDPNGANSDFFGRSVAISGDPPRDVPGDEDFFTVVVGAPFDSILGQASPDNSGSATLFQLSADGSNWGFKARFTADVDPFFDAQAGAQFGVSVAIAADSVVVGASEYNRSGPTRANSGKAYSFGRINIIAN